MTLNWSKIEVPLAAGLNTKGDLRAGQPPKLDIAHDVWFEEPGGVQTRLPFAAMSNAIFGGGTLANCRRLAVVNDELCVFTETSLYSWNAQLSAWVLRGTHLAAAVSEAPVFATTGDQIDGDRAELNGTVVCAWTEGSLSYVSATDKVTGAVLMSQSPQPGFADVRPRLVALATKILLFLHDGVNNLFVIAIDPANPAASISGGATLVLGAVANLYYDVVRIPGQDKAIGAVRRTTTTSHTVFTVTAAAAIATSTKARTADGPLAVSVTPDGLQTQIVRGNGTNVQGDLITTATLADVFTGQAIGTAGATPITNIAAAHRSVQDSGQFRCYVWWTVQESAAFGPLFDCKFNWVNNGNALGTQAIFVPGIGLASRAFDYNGRIYVWFAFGQTSVFQGSASLADRTNAQNAYFLYRDDGFLVAKAGYNRGGGLVPTIGRLSGAALTASKTFSWCGGLRRTAALGGDSSAYAARSLLDVTVTFDSGEARRTARIGRTLYVAAGEILQYDGAQLTECGFHVYPFEFDMLKSGTGSVPTGVVPYKLGWRWQNAKQERERSTTATIGLATMTGGPAGFVMGTGSPLTITHKPGVAIEVWRGLVNAGVDTPFYLATSNDPGATLTSPNGYIVNNPAVAFAPSVNNPWRDEMSDAVLTTNEVNPENGDALEALCPPGARLIAATDTRAFLGGVSGDPDRFWPSRIRAEGEIASFHDSLPVAVPPLGGDMTALAFNNETLTVFRETAIYAFPGDGLNNLGQGSNYGPSRTISEDVGAISQETVALTPLGTIFKSSKGWYLLTPAWGLRYIGAQVNTFDADTVVAVTVLESKHHVRILSNARMLIWDYSAVTEQSPLGQWGEWTIGDGLHAVMWQGRHVYLTATGPKQEQSSYTGLTYGLDVETAWLKPTDQQGEFLLRWMAALGEYRSAHLLRMRLARDYLYDGAGNPVYFDDFAWSPSPTVVGSALQVKHPPSTNRLQALKVRITAVTEQARATLITTALAPQIATSGTVWTATWQAVSTLPGEMGNRLTMSIAFVPFVAPAISELPYTLPFSFLSATASVVVNDHFAWSVELGRWREDLNNVGVTVAGTLTVANLEAAIAEGTKLVTLASPDASPSKTVDVAALLAGGIAASAPFSAGAYGVPTGEALKLTGLAMEIGVYEGINKRLAQSQKAA